MVQFHAMIYMGNRGSSHFALSQLILIVHLRGGRLSSHGGHSSVHSLQPLVQLISLAEVEPDGLFLSLALQTVADALLEGSRAQRVRFLLFVLFKCDVGKTPHCN